MRFRVIICSVQLFVTTGEIRICFVKWLPTYYTRVVLSGELERSTRTKPASTRQEFILSCGFVPEILLSTRAVCQYGAELTQISYRRVCKACGIMVWEDGRISSIWVFQGWMCYLLGCHFSLSLV